MPWSLARLRGIGRQLTCLMRRKRSIPRVVCLMRAWRLAITITDNGSGFVVEDALKRGGGKGLSNQLNRAKSIGAELLWNSSPAGTCLTLRLPLHSVENATL